MSIEAVYALADRSILFATLQSRAWNARLASLGEHRWDVDVEAGTVTFAAANDPTRRFVVPADLVATVNAGMVLWGWAHPQGRPDGVAARLREHGQQQRISELTDAQLTFTADYATSPETWKDDTAMVIGLVATEITGKAPVFIAPTGDIRAVFLLNTPLAAPTVAEAAEALPAVLGVLPLRDARTSVWGLARLSGWGFEWTDAAYTAAVITDSTARLRVSFDPQSRISGLVREG